MSLRQKTLLIIGVILLCLLITLYVSLSTLWLKGFAEVESRQIYQNVERVTEALANDLIELNSIAGDWSAWDETHTFVEDGISISLRIYRIYRIVFLNYQCIIPILSNKVIVMFPTSVFR